MIGESNTLLGSPALGRDGRGDPERIGRFVVLDRLGQGGMGTVFSAYDPELDRKVAVKILRVSSADAEASARMQREARAMARLSDPHVVAVHEVGMHEGHIFIAMALVKGRTLRAWLVEQPRPCRPVVSLFVEAGRGLAAAHAAGIVHRDFKPDNVLVDERDRALVTDFGLARPQGSTLDGDARTIAAYAQSGASSDAITEHGAVVGTPAYMAPEQIMGRGTDERSDQFSFCVALWEALYGARPFQADNLVDLAATLTSGELRDPQKRARVPKPWHRALRRGLAREPAQRWPSMDALLEVLAKDPTRARRQVAMLVGVVAIGFGGLSWQRVDAARKTAACEEVGASIEAVWPGTDDQTRTAVGEAMLASGASGAATAVEKVQPWLDRYARAWQHARTQTCLRHDVEESWSDDTDSRAAECLDERRAELEALVQELGRADATVVHRAVIAAAGLPTLEPCEDEGALGRRLAVPADEDVSARLREELARASALGRAGKYADSITVGEAVLAAAEGPKLRRFRAQAHALMGRALEQAGDYDRAERELIDAYVVAGEAGATETAENAATRLVFVVGDRLARHNEGLLWGRLAEVELGRLGAGENDLMSAPRLNSLANVRTATGAHAEASELYERVVAIYESELGPDHPEVAASLNNLGFLHNVTGEYGKAQALHERALAIRENALGPDHPEVAKSLINLGVVHRSTGDLAGARALVERALAISEDALGADHPQVATSLDVLASVHFGTGDLAKAQTLYERVLVIREKTYGVDHPEVAMILGNLGYLHEQLGDYAAAQAQHERALAIMEKALGPDHADVAKSLANLAEIHRSRGDYAKSQALHERALAIREKALGHYHGDVASSLGLIAAVHLAAGDHARARAFCERALAISVQAFGPDHTDVAKELMRLADIHRAIGSYAEASAFYERALAIVEKTLGPNSSLVSMPLVGLAEVALAQHRPAEGVARVERALAVLEPDDKPGQHLAKVRFVLAKALWESKQDRARALDLATRAVEELRSDGSTAQQRLADLADVEGWLARAEAQ